MTVTYKGLIGRQATNSKGVRTYTRTYKLETDSRSDDEYAVGSNINLPYIGATHPSDPFAWCTSLDIDNAWPWKGWQATATFSSEYEMNENPLNDAIRVSTDSEKYEVVAEKDNSGDAILNSAGDYFSEPPVMRDATGLVIHIEKNLSIVPSYVLTLPNAVNSSSFTISGISVATRQAKIDRVAVSTTQQRNGVSFVTLSIDLNCREETWDKEPLQAGFTFLKDGKRVRATNEGDNSFVTSPVLLDSSGGMITDPLPSQAVYGSFRVYPEIDFNSYIPLF